MSLRKATFWIIIVLLIDQISKIYVKTHFVLGEDVTVFSWFKIYFVENNGMAWGTKLSDIFTFLNERTAKTILTLFRIIAIIGIGYWIYNTTKFKHAKILIIAQIFIFAGALGNIIDSVFYGLFFSDSYSQVATLVNLGSGYDDLLHGRVVDMVYLPIWQGYLPYWIPWIGGDYFTFFEPVFNVADVAICIGFVILIFWNRTIFKSNSR